MHTYQRGHTATRYVRETRDPAPIIGQVVHFYEVRNGDVYGPYAAIVTVVDSSVSNTVHLAVIGEAALRFVPLVPYNDGGEEARMWWKWPEGGTGRRIKQNGL